MTAATFGPWRDLLAFGLSTVESLDVTLWSISCSDRGDRLSLHLGGHDPDEARRVASALGVEDGAAVERFTDTTFSVGSRGPAPLYYMEEPYPYMGASVPFGDRLVEISVACGLPSEARPEDDEVSR